MKALPTSFTRAALGCLLILLSPEFLSPVAVGQVWTVIAFEAKGDGRDPRLPDTAQMSYRYNKEADMLWFRISLYGMPDESTAVTIAVDTGSDDSPHRVWWGTNKDFRFNKLLTFRRGVTGIADVDGMNRGDLANVVKGNLQVGTEADSVLIGVKRTDLTDTMKISLIAVTSNPRIHVETIPNGHARLLDE